MLEAEGPSQTRALSELYGLVAKLEANMCQVVLGKPSVVRHTIVALLAG